ncbi:MAG: hypothetical protein ACR2P2_13785 [Nakamurella sp.]
MTRPLVVQAELLLVDQSSTVIATASNISPVAAPPIRLSAAHSTNIDSITLNHFSSCSGTGDMKSPSPNDAIYVHVFAYQYATPDDLSTTQHIADAFAGPLSATVG